MKCNCEPCGPLCNCTCHDTKNEYMADGGERAGDLIASDNRGDSL